MIILKKETIIMVNETTKYGEADIEICFNPTEKAIQTETGIMYQYRVRIDINPASGGHYSNRALLWLTEAEALVNKNKFVDKLVEELID